MKPKELVTYFCFLWNNKFPKSKPYFPLWGKDGRNAKRLSAQLGPEEVRARMEAFFEDEDDYLYKSGYSFGVFIFRINQYGKQLASVARARSEAIRNRKKLDELPQDTSPRSSQTHQIDFSAALTNLMRPK